MSASNTLSVPGTPSGQTVLRQHIESVLTALNHQWGLQLEIPKDGESPAKRAQSRNIEQQCVARIRLICTKTSIISVQQTFNDKAAILYTGWVHKPKAERGVVPPKDINRPHPVSEKERYQLLHCLFELLEPEFHRAREISIKTPRKTPSGNGRKLVDDSPLPFPKIVREPDSKRHREDLETAFQYKKAKTQKPIQEPITPEDMPPPEPNSRNKVEPQPWVRHTVNANTSFSSTISRSESIFSRQDSSSTQGTQTSLDTRTNELPLLKQAQETREAFVTPQEDKQKSSDYGSSFDASLVPDVIEDPIKSGEEVPTPEKAGEDQGLSQDLLDRAVLFDPVLEASTPQEAKFLESLSQVFFNLPVSLRYASFRAIYEITRVFLHAGVALADAKAFPSAKDLEHYDILWKFLQDVPILRGKSFPDKCEPNVWDAAADDSRQSPRDVIYSGALRFNESDSSGPFFKLQLQPMKLDRSHRLSRLFGSDRFLELDIPLLTGRHIPKNLQALEDWGQNALLQWLVDSVPSSLGHPLFGRAWKPFYGKPKERKHRKTQSDNSLEEAEAGHRLIFFAVDVPANDSVKTRSSVEISNLLNCVRPTSRNGYQPFLKLFARNALALSRTIPTITLRPTQIIRLPDIIHKNSATQVEEVMTDGAGRISPALALKVTLQLGLSYMPSGFQGRIGEAKGFWTVDNRTQHAGDWIEVYDSQCKWKLDSEDHAYNRVFEVLRWSSPLKSADLNLQFLPLLVERARSKRNMQKALAALLEDGLETELKEMKEAMRGTQNFRGWLRSQNSSIDERLKHGRVPYKVDFPVQTHERINLLLDSGFDPNTWLVKDLAKVAFLSKCNELKERLNITVRKSAYAYMVPDFWDCLEPGEVFIDFTSFVDNESGFSDINLNRQDVLVARSPANYASDIQKATVVFKEELFGLKDVIVFSTKKDPTSRSFSSLAAKLSGGDYDGDIAWVCWEPSIVDNFEHVDVPNCPNLVKEGLISQNKTTYDQLVSGCPDPTSVFIRESLAFNLQQNMLGICTSYKDNVVYTKQRYDTDEAVYLSTLLSNLVDQAKQGYVFTESHWDIFKKRVVKYNVRVPEYKKHKGKNKQVFKRDSEWIIERLMYHAHRVVEKALRDFSDSNGKECPSTDSDLVAYYKEAKNNALNDHQWARVIQHLDQDLQTVKDQWNKDYDKRLAENMKQQRKAGNYTGDPMEEIDSREYMTRMETWYYNYQKILPFGDDALTKSLLPACFPEESSQWALLRASALFHSYSRNAKSRVPWFMAGRQLCRLKSIASGNGDPNSVIPSMYAALKPDATYIKRAKSLGTTGMFDDSASVANADELEELRENF